jgi:DNA replication protein DnaC
VLAVRAAEDAEKLNSRVRYGVGDSLKVALELTHEERLEKMRPKLRKWASTYKLGKGALLIGPTGVGKTIACVDMIDRLIRCHEGNATPRMLSATSIGQMVAYGQVKYDDIMELDDIPLLIIDDLGWEPEVGAPAIREVLARRYSEGLPTIITSGWTLEDLRKRYGDALIRRAIETRGQPGVVIDLHPKANADA